MDFISFTLFAGEEGGGLIVANDLFGLRIPADHSAQPRGDRAKMADIHRLNVTGYVGDRKPTLADAAVEVLLVVLKRFAFIEADEVLLPELALVPFLLDRLAGDYAAIDEDPSLGSLEIARRCRCGCRRSSRCRWRTCI